VEETFAPGANWVGTNNRAGENTRHSAKIKYWINKAADSVHLWTVTDVPNDFGNYTATALYTAGELFKNITVDEHGKQVIEFKDKEGHIILKKVQLTATADDNTGKGHYGWICTYYVYDDLGNLRLVVQPKGVEALMQNSWNTTALSGILIMPLAS
jgi:hypothetical protein